MALLFDHFDHFGNSIFSRRNLQTQRPSIIESNQPKQITEEQRARLMALLKEGVRSGQNPKNVLPPDHEFLSRMLSALNEEADMSFFKNSYEIGRICEKVKSKVFALLGEEGYRLLPEFIKNR